MSQPQSALVVCAHSADFVWRTGGAIASHTKQGWKVKIVCLCNDERGPSAKLWKQAGMTLEKAEAVLREDAQRAAEILGGDVEFWDMGGYPLRVSDDTLFRLVDLYHTLQPAFVLSHSEKDSYNFDNPRAMHVTQVARVIAQTEDHNPGQKILGAPPVYTFEPHQAKQCGWEPNTFLDITDVWDAKRRAIECMAKQKQLWHYYAQVAQQRGLQARRSMGITAKRSIEYAESVMRLTPQVVEVL